MLAAYLFGMPFAALVGLAAAAIVNHLLAGAPL